MLQFTAQEMAQLRARVTQPLIAQLIDNNQVVLNNDTLVPPDARATWNLYYFCPEHGVRLSWRRDHPDAHQCPVDGKEFHGEPYDGAWWRWLNTLNATACYELGLLWQLTQDDRYFTKVSDILLQYARYYPDYEEHGGIPYNGPGKANAQTLCEANCHLDFARGYDFIRDELSLEQRQTIEQRLLREGANFLIKHRSAQLHNHEMKINATIGVIGLLLDDQAYLEFALNTDYGIHYQLDHGCLGEGMWFEGSIHYHYYALQALLAFEKLAHRTPYSVSHNQNLIKMLRFPLQLVLTHGEFPKLNDCIAGQEKLTHSAIFEFAYQQYGDPLFGQALNAIYQHQPRNQQLEALLYGVETLPATSSLGLERFHAPQAGFTLANHHQQQHALLVKHAPYGGEHDHYDRLSFILIRQGLEILPDLGTTGYGAELHRGYYKNSATHNTLTVNQTNQPPLSPLVLAYLEHHDYLLVDTLADWNQAAHQLDSHTLIEWDDSAYHNVRFRRIMLWLGDAAIEINRVDNPHQQNMDLVYHVRGTHQLNSDWHSIDNPLDGPLQIMQDCHQGSASKEPVRLVYRIEHQSPFQQSLACDSECTLLTGYAPDNPATSQLAYTLVRSRQPQLTTLMLHDLTARSGYHLKWVNFDQQMIEFVLEVDNCAKVYRYDLDQHQLTSDLLANV